MKDKSENEATKKVFSKEQLQRMSSDALKVINDDQTIEIKKTLIVETEVEEEPVLEETLEAEVVEEEIQEEPKKKKLNKKKLIIIIVAIVLLFLLLFGTFAFLIMHKKKDNKKKTNEVIVKKDNYQYANGTLKFLSNGKEIGSYTCKNKHVDECFVANYNNTEDNFLNPKLVYEDGKLVEDVSDFINNQYAFIKDGKNKNIIIYDFVNKKEIDKVEKVKYYGKDNYVILTKNNKYGLFYFGKDSIDIKIDYIYEYMGVILGSDEGNDLVVKSGETYKIIDYTNNDLSKPIGSPIRNYNKDYIVAGEDNKLNLYDYKAKVVFSKNYSYIKLLADYVLVVNDLELNVLDYEGNKYNLNPITLKNSSYVSKNVYDKNGKKVKTEESFTEAIKENTMTITVKGESDTKVLVNLLEGKLSKNLKYISYFDGTLYFYGDEDKTKLIGQYKCDNKNTVDTDTTALNNCFVASDTIYENNDMESNADKTIGVIPIINNTFVFISDSKPSDSKKTVKLYNLKTSKVVGVYQTVSTYLFSGLEELSFAEINSLEFIARNNKGKMGLIKIIGSEVASGIKFNYLSLEKMGKYYLAKDENAKYLLIYDTTGQNTSSTFNGPIKGYNKDYIKVVEGNKYYIYDFDNTKITTIGYKYIELLDNYYVAVNDSNNVVVYNYQNEQKLSDEIKLYSNKYTDPENPAFRVELFGYKITISVLKDNIYTDYDYDLQTGTRVEG
ncbi:MAG: hypothetical protein J5892_00940 [Bacilli bacterium]|nr:hypothetical protein [Bacilli bacterium]